MAHSTVVSLSVAASTQPVPSVGSVIGNIAQTFGVSLVDGTLVGQADTSYWGLRPLAASASESLNLTSGALLDPFGQPVVFARLKVVIISAAIANTNNVLIGGAGGNTAPLLFNTTASVDVARPGGTKTWMVNVADAIGYPVGSTNNLLQIANSGSGTAINYTIVLIGCSV